MMIIRQGDDWAVFTLAGGVADLAFIGVNIFSGAPVLPARVDAIHGHTGIWDAS